MFICGLVLPLEVWESISVVTSPDRVVGRRGRKEISEGTSFAYSGNRSHFSARVLKHAI